MRIQETVEAKPELALAFLEHLFSHGSSREKLLALGKKPLKQLHAVLGGWKVRHRSSHVFNAPPGGCLNHCLMPQQSVLHAHLSSTADHPQIPGEETALKVFSYHSRLGAHLHHHVSFLFIYPRVKYSLLR